MVKNITLEAPASCFDLAGDGYTIGIGTEQGFALIYDVRKQTVPLYSVKVATGRVRSLKFQFDTSALSLATPAGSSEKTDSTTPTRRRPLITRSMSEAAPNTRHITTVPSYEPAVSWAPSVPTSATSSAASSRSTSPTFPSTGVNPPSVSITDASGVLSPLRMEGMCFLLRRKNEKALNSLTNNQSFGIKVEVLLM